MHLSCHFTRNKYIYYNTYYGRQNVWSFTIELIALIYTIYIRNIYNPSASFACLEGDKVCTIYMQNES